MLLARIRHARAVRLIHQTPVTPIGDLVQSFTAHPDPSTRTHAAVQGCVVARDTTRLTAPITGSSCVAYEVRVFYDPGDDETPDKNYIEDSEWVPWAVDDGTGLALAPFNPFEPPKEFNRDHYCYWPGRESTGDTFKNNTPHHPLSISILPGQEREEASSSPLDRVISHYGRERLPSPEGWGSHSYEDLSWEVSILKEFGNEVFPRISDLAPLTARVYTLTRRSATISPPERGGG